MSGVRKSQRVVAESWLEAEAPVLQTDGGTGNREPQTPAPPSSRKLALLADSPSAPGLHLLWKSTKALKGIRFFPALTSKRQFHRLGDPHDCLSVRARVKIIKDGADVFVPLWPVRTGAVLLPLLSNITKLSMTVSLQFS